jgi:hypothetical protein
MCEYLHWTWDPVEDRSEHADELQFSVWNTQTSGGL